MMFSFRSLTRQSSVHWFDGQLEAAVGLHVVKSLLVSVSCRTLVFEVLKSLVCVKNFQVVFN